MLSVYLSMVETDDEKDLITRLYGEYEQLMYKTAFAILENRQDAEDIVHDAFMRIIRNLPKLYFDFNIKTEVLLIIIVKNLSLNLLKKNNRSVPTDEIETEAVDEAAYEEYLRLEDIGAEELILMLPEELKEVMALRFIHEIDVKTISSMLGLAEQTIYSRIRKARKLMKEYMNEREGNNAETEC